MRRRDFLAGVAGAAAQPLAARGQERVARTVGWLSLRSATADTETSILAAFRQGMNQTGYVEGRNLSIEFRFGDGQYDRLPALAGDLVSRKVDVLVTSGGTPIARAAQNATSTIPIVFATASDPVQDGLVKSINRPGGNSTGTHLLNNALIAKRMEVLRTLTPDARVIGFLFNPNSSTATFQLQQAQTAARTFAVQLHPVHASVVSQIDAAFADFLQRRVDALVMGSDPFFQVHQDQVIALAARHRLPTVYEWSEFARAGGLASYSADRTEMWRQMGVYASRILNGAKPAELPVMQPTKFELVVNMRTARALGLKITESFLHLADEVIE